MAVPSQSGGQERGVIAVQKAPWKSIWTQEPPTSLGVMTPLQGQQVNIPCVSQLYCD